jgi:HK97 family phage prohead protease
MEHDNGREWFSASAEFKFAGEETPVGEFTGYASTFGNVDLGGDIIERGAFLETLSRKSPSDVLMLLQHNARSYPIGDWLEMRENDQGLIVRGRLDLEDPDGARVYNAMKKGRLKGLSIGYMIPKGGADMDRNGTRRLKKISLAEISIVTVPMNPRAQANRVKDALSVKQIRDLEATLREKSISRADAVTAVSCFKDWIQRDAEVPNTTPRDEVVAAELAEILRRNIATLS